MEQLSQKRNRLPVFVISLDRDWDRRRDLMAVLDAQATLAAEVVSGVHGPSLPDAACLALTENLEWMKRKGTIGCFLSHVAAWERVASASGPFGVVLEDDAVASPGLEAIATLAIPPDAEIVFLNDWMCGDSGRELEIRPIRDALLKLHETNHGSGGCGYMLSKAGARKLLAALRTDIYFGHVDGRLLRYAVTEEDVGHLPEGSGTAYAVRHHFLTHRPPRIGLLKGYCLNRPLVLHSNHDSIRDEMDNTSLMEH